MARDVSILARDPEGVGPASHLISIFDPTDLGQALFDNGWTNSKAIELLTEIARDTVNNSARERMAAVKMLDDKAEKSLSLAGIIRRISMEASQDQDGTKKKLTADGLQLIKEGAARTLSTLALLEAGAQTSEIIDVDPPLGENSSERSPNEHVPAPECAGPNSECPRPSGPGGGPNGTVSGGGLCESGPGTSSVVHGPERTNPPHSQGQSPNDDPTTIGGTENERSQRTPIEPGRGIPSSSPGRDSPQPQRQHGQDNGPLGPTSPRPAAPHSATVRPGQRGTTNEPESRPGGHTSPIPRRTTPGLCEHIPGQVPNTQRRTTPYTPGEARRRATAFAAEVPPGPAGGPDSPTVSTPRPSDGDPDTPKRGPRIAARYLPPGLAATGFPGDSGE